MRKALVEQQEAVRALSLMAMDISCFEDIVASGAIQALLDLLCSSEALMSSATVALSRLSSHEVWCLLTTLTLVLIVTSL